MRWWWLAFVDEGKNKFLGGCYVIADYPDGEADPLQEAWNAKINPGGAVCMAALETTNTDMKTILPFMPYRLYSEAEINDLDGGQMISFRICKDGTCGDCPKCTGTMI